MIDVGLEPRTSWSTGRFVVPQWLAQQMAMVASRAMLPAKPPSRPLAVGLAGSEQGAPAPGSSVDQANLNAAPTALDLSRRPAASLTIRR